MPAFVAHHSRAQRGKVHDVWHYRVHYSPVTPHLQFGVSKGGLVLHRARDLAHALEWALDRTQEFYNRHAGVPHDAVREALAALQQHGRMLDVAQS